MAGREDSRVIVLDGSFGRGEIKELVRSMGYALYLLDMTKVAYAMGLFSKWEVCSFYFFLGSLLYL